MITFGKIKKEFEFFDKTDNDNGFYSGGLEFKNQNRGSELYFMAVDKKVSNKQIANFNNFMAMKTAVRIKAENFVLEDIEKQKYPNYKRFLKGDFQFDIITVYTDNSESDIEIICSKSYKKLFWTKRLDYVIFMKEFKVSKIIKFGV